MQKLLFITGNQDKADYLQRLLGVEVEHQKLDLDEIQSIDLDEIVRHKVLQAYEIVKRPVLVEDVSLEFNALKGLPGPFIKYFVEETGLDSTAKMLDGHDDRSAVARCTFGYYDGDEIRFFRGSLEGEISKVPKGDGGYGWDKIFIPLGYGGRTRAQLTDEENDETYQIIKPFEELRDYLLG